MSKFDNIDKMIDEELAQVTEVTPNGSEVPVKRRKAYDVLLFGTEVVKSIDSEKTMTNNSADREKNNITKSVEKEKLDIEWIDCEDPAKKKKKNIKNFTYNITRYAIMLFALIIFAYAAYELTVIYVESKEATESFSGTEDMFLVDIDSLTDDYEAPTNAEGETIELVNKDADKFFIFDYEKMLEYNSDSKGYIRQDDGEYIDNPILQAADNDYYLKHLANHKKSSIGAIFIDYRIEQGLNARNCIIYGHNIGSRVNHNMFGSLKWYNNKTNYYKEHPTFDIWIENTRYRYYVYAVFKTDASGSEVFTYNFESDEDFMAYVDMCRKQSKYKITDVPEITKDSHIITLSTCTTDKEKRQIIQLVRGEELDIYGNPVVSEPEVQE